MTRIGTLSIALTIWIVFAAEPSAAQAACSRWDVSGAWRFFQSNGYVAKFNLQQTATGIQGEARTLTHEGFHSAEQTGSVDGALHGDSFKVTVYWHTGAIGVYTGTIGPQGRIEGTTYDAALPGSMASWRSDRTAKCADVTSAGGVSPSSTTPPAASAQETASFQSVNYPGQFLRHQNFLGELTPLSSELDRKDATFVLRPGLSGTPGAVSFESVNYPGQFLRHQNFRLKLNADDGTPLFRQDASFWPRSALAGQGTVSYESVNFPGFFIRHRDFHLWVEQNDGSALFSLDASFRQTP